MFWLGAGQAGLDVLGVPGEPELPSMVVWRLVVLQRQGAAAEGTGGMGAPGSMAEQPPQSPPVKDVLGTLLLKRWVQCVLQNHLFQLEV